MEQSNLELDKFSILLDPNQINYFLDNTKNIKSEVIRKELFKFWENIKIDYDKENSSEIFYSIVSFFYNTGNISKAFDMISRRRIRN